MKGFSDFLSEVVVLSEQSDLTQLIQTRVLTHKGFLAELIILCWSHEDRELGRGWAMARSVWRGTKLFWHKKRNTAKRPR